MPSMVVEPAVHLRNPPSHEDVRRRAYEIYVERGRQPGRELEDWAQAERELTLGTAIVPSK